MRDISEKNVAFLNKKGHLILGEVPRGFDALVLADLVRASRERGVFYIAYDAKHIDSMQKLLEFFAPEIICIILPAWDCLPYDRVGASRSVMAQRMASLTQLYHVRQSNMPYVVLTSVNAVTQRLPSYDLVKQQSFIGKVGQHVQIEDLTHFLVSYGYNRCSLVTEQGEFAIRGGIIDIFPSGNDMPIRLDFFGDTLDSIRRFDVETQRSIAQETEFTLIAAGEVQLSDSTISQFKKSYIEIFGTITRYDRLYESIIKNIPYQGFEHWLPLFHVNMDTVFTHACGALFVLDHLCSQAIEDRFLQIKDYYQARLKAKKLVNDGQYAMNPLPTDRLYMTSNEWSSCLKEVDLRNISSFRVGDLSKGINLNAHPSRNFHMERRQENVNIFDILIKYIHSIHDQGKKVFIASWSHGARERLTGLMEDHGFVSLQICDDWISTLAVPKKTVGLMVLGLESGFETESFVVISEQDILGDRLIRRKSSRKAVNYLIEVSSLSSQDLVIHIDHGLGRFQGLKVITVDDAHHDCLEIVYAGDEKLFLPVENIELLSRYGSNDAKHLDKLGGGNWQNRKARLKNKLRDIARDLIQVAAQRGLNQVDKINVPDSLYKEFCASFMFDETEDQLACIEAVISDLSSGCPMDRLICGDVGFGKTEIALRATFIVAMSGKQVAIVTPTTLLARQHAQTFRERFSGFPICVRELSRLTRAKEAAEVRQGLSEGSVDIVIGTHTLLHKTISFRHLALAIIDEEQHFGVVHKEQLKKLRAQIHILTLTATPIPRTLQLSLVGVRDLSLMTTPPVDRLAIRTYISPFDSVVIREALLREKYRGGNSFFICPRISDLNNIEKFLRESVPEVTFVTVHGQMNNRDIENRISAFYDRQYDVLLSTTIVESGIDIPSANTIVIYRASLFGLGQLYQIRGRVGRSKQRAYAYITYDEDQLTESSKKRLKILQSLDHLGAGFTLASHDLDLRGSGNLLGEEQSGHIREVGYETYQAMLEEAIAQQQGVEQEGTWSPQVNMGVSVLFPESYICDFEIRMGLYRRLSLLEDTQDIEGFAAELIDRFGSLPKESEYLIQLVAIKILCKKAGVEKINTGTKGVTIHFRKRQFSNPIALADFINHYAGNVKLRPDCTLVFKFNWIDLEERLKSVRDIIKKLVELANISE